MLARFQWIGIALWEPLGVVFAVGLVWLLLRMMFAKAWKNSWAWLFWVGAVYALAWRSVANVQGDRYHNIFILIGIFCIVGLWRSFPLPRQWKRVLFAILLAVCVGRDLSFNPQDFEIRDLYRKVELDSRQYPRVMGVDYSTNGRRDGYYGKITVYGVERPITLAHLVKNLNGNLSVYDGDFDAVYLFCTVNKDEAALLDEFLVLAPERRVEKIGSCWLDRHRKKQLAIFRYRPAPQPQLSHGGELIFNGDFTQLATERDKQGLVDGLGKRMMRLQTEPFEFPAGWTVYQSLAGKTNAFVTRVKRGGQYALRLEADGYLAATPKAITVTEDKVFSFTVYAEKDSLLQFTRAGNGIGMLPVLLLPLKAGMTRRHEIQLSPYPDCEKNEIWFWLDHGTIELFDVRIK